MEIGEIVIGKSFKELALQINKNEPTKDFAANYFAEASSFVDQVKKYRSKKVIVETINSN